MAKKYFKIMPAFFFLIVLAFLPETLALAQFPSFEIYSSACGTGKNCTPYPLVENVGAVQVDANDVVITAKAMDVSGISSIVASIEDSNGNIVFGDGREIMLETNNVDLYPEESCPAGTLCTYTSGLISNLQSGVTYRINISATDMLGNSNNYPCENDSDCLTGQGQTCCVNNPVNNCDKNPNNTNAVIGKCVDPNHAEIYWHLPFNLSNSSSCSTDSVSGAIICISEVPSLPEATDIIFPSSYVDAGNPATLSATLEFSSRNNSIANENIMFNDLTSSVAIGTAETNSHGVASISYQTSVADRGTHNIKATFNGDGSKDALASNQTTTLVINNTGNCAADTNGTSSVICINPVNTNGTITAFISGILQSGNKEPRSSDPNCYYDPICYEVDSWAGHGAGTAVDFTAVLKNTNGTPLPAGTPIKFYEIDKYGNSKLLGAGETNTPFQYLFQEPIGPYYTIRAEYFGSSASPVSEASAEIYLTN